MVSTAEFGMAVIHVLTSKFFFAVKAFRTNQLTAAQNAAHKLRTGRSYMYYI